MLSKFEEKTSFFVSHFDGFLKRLCAFGVKIKLSTWPNQTISHVWFVNIATLLFVFSLLSMLRKPSQLTIENKRTDGIKQDHGGGGAFHILLWIFIGKAHLILWTSMDKELEARLHINIYYPSPYHISPRSIIDYLYQGQYPSCYPQRREAFTSNANQHIQSNQRNYNSGCCVSNLDSLLFWC